GGLQHLLIDDLGHASRYLADLVLDQNVCARELLYEGRAPGTKLLLGPRYALLRREFRMWGAWRRNIPKRAERVLVMLGGSDPDNVTRRVIQALQSLSDDRLKVAVVYGPMNPHIERLEGLVAGRGSRWRLLENVADAARW